MNLLTPRQVGQALGVSEASVKRWCDQGRLENSRTAGGHRRIPLRAVLTYLRERGETPVRPEVLGLPSSTGKGSRGLEKSREPLRRALEAGDRDQASSVALNLFLAGFPAAAIFDRCLGPALHDLGQEWECGDLAIYQERRGCGIARQLVQSLGDLLPPPAADAPRALGGTLGTDPYSVPTAMVEVVLRECGWDAQSLGTGLPASTLQQALRAERPDLFWLSVSHISDREKFLEEYRQLQGAAAQLGIPVVVGGRVLDADLRVRMTYTAFCDTLSHLATIATTLGGGDGKATARAAD